MDAPGLSDGSELGLREAPVAPDLHAEFPELRLLSLTLAARPGPSPRAVKRQLKGLSDRFRGAQAVTMRQDPIPWAYRVFYRQVGIDPDAQRTPVEAAALERLLRGRFESHNLLDDALTIALVETGVPLWALDAEEIQDPLELRPAAAGERLGRADGAAPAPEGRLVVADAKSPIAAVFGHPTAPHGVTARTTRMTLYSLQVAGVPAIHVEEAFWTCLSILGEA